MKITLFPIALFLCIFNLSAQTPQLSLSDAIATGLANNYDITIQRQNVEISSTNNTWGETSLFPTLSASLQGSYNSSENKELVNPFAFLAKTSSTQLQPSVNLNWNLFQIYDIKITKRRLEQLQAESEGNAQIVIQNTLQSLILGYYIAVLERERLNQFREQLVLSWDKYQLLETRKELGDAVTSDLLLEEVNYLEDSLNVVNQGLIYKNAIANLNFLMGVSEPAPTYVLSDSLDYLATDINFEDLVALMERENVDLATMYLTQSVLSSDVNLASSERFPSLSLGANYSRSNSLVDISDWPERIRENDDGTLRSSGNNKNVNWGANFTLSFTLFNGGKINRAIQRAKLQENIGSLRVDRLKASLRRDLKQAYDRYTTRKQLFQINKRRKESALENLEINTNKYKNGTINSFDFRTIQNVYLRAAIQELQSVYDMMEARVSILRLSGGLLESYE